MLPRVVEPGASVELAARVRPPEEPGTYRVEWSLVREGVRWFPAPTAGEATWDLRAGGEAFGWEILAMGAPRPPRAGEVGEVRVRLRNIGCATWDPDLGDRIGTTWFDADGRRVLGADARTELGAAWPPGAERDVRVRLVAPEAVGCYRVRVEPVREQVRWFGAPAAGEAWSDLLCQGPRPLRYELGPAHLGELGAGDRLRVPLQLRNVGDERLGPEDGDLLAYHWRDTATGEEIFEGERTPLPLELQPGDAAEVEARLVAPPHAGSWALRWELVRDGVRWHGPPASEQEPLLVAVGGPRLAFTLEEHHGPSTAWRGRTHLRRVRLRNTGSASWEADRDLVGVHVLGRDERVLQWDGPRTPLPHPVAPGATVDLLVPVRIDAEATSVHLQVDLVREGERWFGSIDRAADPGAVVRVRRPELAALVVLGGLAFLALALGLVARPPILLCTAVAVAIVALQLVLHGAFPLEPLGGAERFVLSFAMLLALPVLLLPPRARALVGVLVVLVAAAIILADLAHLRYFGALVSPEALGSSRQVLEILDSAVILVGWERLILVLAFVAAVVLVAAVDTRRGARRAGWPEVVLVLTAAIPAVVRLGEALVGPLGVRVFSDADNLRRFGPLGAHAFGAARHLVTPPRADPSAEEREATLARLRAHGVARPRSAAFGTAAQADVILIQAEALQTWVLDAEVGGELVAPFLHDFGETGLRFDHVWDQTAHGNTSDAEYLLLTGQHPLSAGALAFLRADTRFHTLAHELAARGYATGSAHPYDPAFWNRAVLHPRYGFARSTFGGALGEGPIIGWGLADRAFLPRALELHTDAPRPRFSFWITLGLHHPYTHFPAHLAELPLGSLAGTPLGNYLEGVRHLDHAVEELFAALRASGALARTVVVIVGDHDARLELTPELARLAGFDWGDPAALVRIDRVPVLLHAPGDLQRGISRRLGGQADVPVTILDLLGIDAPASFAGDSLLVDRDFVALPRGAVGSGLLALEPNAIPGDPGGCFVLQGTARRPVAACEEIATRARRERDDAHLVLDADLFAALRVPPQRDRVSPR
jgi:phosphoglycerol transferase MdoB-like AlkP superfamily enzyme